MRFDTAPFATACAALLVLGATACGGSDTQPEMPDPTEVDQSGDDMNLPAPDPNATSGDEAPALETTNAPSSGAAAPVQLIAGDNTPIEGTSPQLRILAPRANQRITTGNVELRVQLRNWILESDPGRHLHVILDNEPYIAVRDVTAPIDLNALVQENLHHEIAEGTHVVRVFPSRAHHESVKTSGAFASVVFHFRTPTESFSFNPRAPLLTYSRPKGCNVAGQRVLLDFYVSNATLAADGTHVRYDIDGTSGDIVQWVPHWIEGLRPGSHTIALTLVGADGSAVAGPFNETRRTFTVAAACP